MKVNLNIWEKVTRESQIKEGSFLKIIGFSEAESYKRVSVKKMLYMENKHRKWTEVVINLRKNYYFNLTAYLKNESPWGKWVKELYVRRG